MGQFWKEIKKGVWDWERIGVCLIGPIGTWKHVLQAKAVRLSLSRDGVTWVWEWDPPGLPVKIEKKWKERQTHSGGMCSSFSSDLSFMGHPNLKGRVGGVLLLTWRYHVLSRVLFLAGPGSWNVAPLETRQVSHSVMANQDSESSSEWLWTLNFSLRFHGFQFLKSIFLAH
jgi:hypothetical protein